MGCDIHALVERKVGDKWVMVNRCGRVATVRNYPRFAALAGVCGDGPDPKGLPPDLSDSGALYESEWGRNGHSHSYLSLPEAAAIYESTLYHPEDKLACDCPCWHFFGIDDERASEHRLVFWFDN